MRIRLCICILILPLLADAWPTGAPAAACESMLPKHGKNIPQPASQAPYTFTQSADHYDPEGQVLVYVQAFPNKAFKGLMVQAFDPRTNETIGEFLEPRDQVGLKKIAECNSMTHTDSRDKKSATLVWKAPRQASGNVKFRATIVKEFSTFYHGLIASLVS